MKRVLAVVVLLLTFTGCRSADSHINAALALRESLLKGNGCSFDAVITADYGDKLYTFEMQCSGDKEGNVSFEVTAPQSISGICGAVNAQGGRLTFDDRALMFELLADGQVTPVSAPWLLINTLRSGYISAAGADETGIRVQIDDSYESDALHLDIWLNDKGAPMRGEILWQGRRIVSLDVENFTIL